MHMFLFGFAVGGAVVGFGVHYYRKFAQAKVKAAENAAFKAIK